MAKKTDTKPISNFKEIIAPVSSDTFFADYYDKKPLHIPGNAKKFPHVMNWEILTRMLNMNAIWSHKNLILVQDRKVIPPTLYCDSEIDRNEQNNFRPNAEKVMRYFEDGASLGINDIDTLTPEIANLVTIFEKTLNAKGQCNLYASCQQRQAFQSHYDTHDVYAIHFEGEKTWRIWSNRMPHPIRHRRFLSTGEEFDLKNRGDVMMEVKMKPGDLLYLPRGWYHDALSSSDACAHIAFGMTHVIGVDLLTNITDIAINDELYRKNFPRHQDGREALRKHAKELVSILDKIVEQDEFLDAFENFQKQFHYQRGGFSLPVRAKKIKYQIIAPNLQVKQHQGQWGLFGPKGVIPIPDGYEKPLEWILTQKKFNRNDFTDRFAHMGIDHLDQFLTDITNMKVIAKL